MAWLAAACASAQLATSSPFLPGQSAAGANAPTAGAPLEFRGQIDMPPDGLKVRIYDPARKTGAWVRVNERDPNNEFVVKQFDSARGTVSVEYRGQTMVLSEHEAKVTSSGAAMPSIPMAGIPMPSAGAQMALNPTPADEQHRLEAVAAEVARRRQLREQAVEQVGQGVPAPQAQPQNTPQQPNTLRAGVRPRSQ
jgi:hypothetical protein